MRDLLGPGTILGYCTNVHPGRTLPEIRANLERYTCRVKQIVCPDEPMGVGLWLSARAAREMIERDQVAASRDWLNERGLLAFTLNGFPCGDFHGREVKYRVYEPNWCDEARLRYTLDLIEILHGILPEGEVGSISTLPIGWRESLRGPGAYRPAIENLLRTAEYLKSLERESGRLIHVDLEPEPGCVLDRAYLLHWLWRELGTAAGGGWVYRYIRVCHDVCHSAVMLDDQHVAFQLARISGLHIGKVQISSAIRCHLDSRSNDERRQLLADLGRFAEERYLHQAMVSWPRRLRRRGERLFDDLPEALADPRIHKARELRVHFHVPIYLEKLGRLDTTQEEIESCLDAVQPNDQERAYLEDSEHDPEAQVRHFEIETYAWNVLPAELQPADLAEGIAREMIWLRDLVQERAET